MQIVRCISCDGYGWLEDEETLETLDCDWCGGVGYVYRLPNGVDKRIPRQDLLTLTEQLEALETERLREMGYQGSAKRPWEQDIRKGTQGGINPYDPQDD